MHARGSGEAARRAKRGRQRASLISRHQSHLISLISRHQSRGGLRVSRFARRTTEKRETARGLSHLASKFKGANSITCSLRASSPIWASKASLARTREGVVRWCHNQKVLRNKQYPCWMTGTDGQPVTATTSRDEIVVKKASSSDTENSVRRRAMANLVFDSPVTLVVKTPNQKVDDLRIDCALEWSVEQLKRHLSSVYPTKPVRFWLPFDNCVSSH